MSKKRLLLVNPWIADFAAFDLWAKPVGLLAIAVFLQEYGYEIESLDLLNRSRFGNPNSKHNDGRGKYQKTIIPKPELLQNIPRQYGLYGATPEQFEQSLNDIHDIDAVLVTSHMTYWYPGVVETVKVLRNRFSGISLILGGIYATLLPEHAQRTVQPDFLVTGYGEKKSLKILDEIFGIPRDYPTVPDYHDGGFLPWHFYEKLESVPILTSRGCPNRCTYCATKLLNPKFIQRKPEDVVREIRMYSEKYKLTNFAFYDDALFFRRDKHIKPILSELVKDKVQRHFHTPNGLFAAEIDAELAELMFASNFDTIRLSLESSIEKWQQASSGKVTNRDFQQAVTNLVRAGYSAVKIETYLLMGLPGQTPDEVESAIRFAADTGAIVRLASFTPIPGTKEWKRAVKMGMIQNDIDPLLTNNSIFSCSTDLFPVTAFENLKQLANELNQSNREK